MGQMGNILIVFYYFCSINYFQISIENMYSKSKKQEDSLVLLQRDLNQLGLAKYNKAKKAKLKAKIQKQKEMNNTTFDYSEMKLPPIYGDGVSPHSKATSVHQAGKNQLMHRIKQFENKIYDLETQNAIQKRQNQKLMDYVAKMRTNHKSLHQTSRNIQNPYHMQQQPMFPQFPNPYGFQPMMGSPQMMAFQNMNTPNMINPYQMPPQQNYQGHGQKTNSSQNSGKAYKKRFKMNPLSNFRIAGFVVFFCHFFKKYSKSFTIHRFDKFKDNWVQGEPIGEAREKLAQYFNRTIPLSIFQRQEISDLDSLRNIEDQQKEEKKNLKKQKNNKNNKKKSKSQQQSDDSDDSSDFESQSQKSSAVDKSSKPNQQNQQSKIFQFYLKIDVAVAFVVQFIKQINKSIASEEFQKQNPFLLLLLSRQFQPDRLHQQEDFKYLGFHSEKGYSKHQKFISEYLLIKNIYLDIFVSNSLLNEFAKRFFIDTKNKSKKTNENRVFFSFYIRTSIFKAMVQHYLQKKIQKCQTYPLPNEELKPFPKIKNQQDPLQNKAVSFENNGIDMKQENIEQISQQEIKKKEKELKLVLDQSCQILMKKLILLRKKQYEQLKQKTLSQKYREEELSYFKLHEKGQYEKDRQKIFIKTTNSLVQSSVLSSRLSSNKAIVKRSSKTMKTKSDNSKSIKSMKTNKTQNQKPKEKPRKITQTSSQDDSD